MRLASGKQRVGTVEWERAGGPPLSAGQRIALLAGVGAVVLRDMGPRLWWLAGLPVHRPPRIDLAAWAPPDSAAVRDAESFMREASSAPMVHHSIRTYWFSAIACDLSGRKGDVDIETMYVAALMHDVGLFDGTPPPGQGCFTVSSAREARRIATDAGWDEARQDRMAMAITSNLNAFVPSDEFGPEAHFLRAGGLIEVIAQEWKVHPENVREILERHPRDGFADDSLARVRREVRRNPGCRFACLDPLFPLMVRRMKFRQETRSRRR